MDPTTRSLINWITFYLAQGWTYDQLLAGFEHRFGSMTDVQFDSAFDAAAQGLANAQNFSTFDTRKQIRNAFNLPGGRQGTVEIRAAQQIGYWEGTGAARHFVVTRRQTVSARFDYTQRIGDVYAQLLQMQGTSGTVGGETIGGIDILPGIYY